MELFQMSFTIRPNDFIPILEKASEIENKLKTGKCQIGNIIHAVKSIKKNDVKKTSAYEILNSLVQNLKNVTPADDGQEQYQKFIAALKEWNGFKDADTAFRTTLLISEKRLGFSKTPENLIRIKEFFRSIGKAIFGSSEKRRLAKAVNLAITESELIQNIVESKKILEKQETEQQGSEAKAKREIHEKENTTSRLQKEYIVQLEQQAEQHRQSLQKKEQDIAALRGELEQVGGMKVALERAGDEHKDIIEQTVKAIHEKESQYKQLHAAVKEYEQKAKEQADRWVKDRQSAETTLKSQIQKLRATNKQLQIRIKAKELALANAEALLSKAPPVLKEKHTPDQYKSLTQYWSLPTTIRDEIPSLTKYVFEEVDLILFNKLNTESTTDEEIREAQIFGKGAFDQFSTALTNYITSKNNYEELAYAIPMYVYDALRSKIEPLSPEKANLLKRVCDQLYQTLMQNFETRHYEGEEEHRALIAGAGYWTDQALLTAISTKKSEEGWKVFRDHLPLRREDWRYDLRLTAGLTRAHMLSTHSTNSMAGEFYHFFLSKVKEEGLA